MYFLAFRHLISRKRQTILTLLGVALGTGAFVTFSAIMLGFQTFIIDQLVNNDAHVRIQAQDKLLTPNELSDLIFADSVLTKWLNTPNSRQGSTKILYPLGWFERLKSDPRVFAYAPQLTTQVIFSRGGTTQGGRLTGVLALQQLKVTNVEKYMVSGKFQSLSSAGQRIVVGEGLMQKIGAQMGDTVMVSTGLGQPTPFKITGVFKFGIHTVDEGSAFAHLNDAQQASYRPSEITDIAIRLNNVDEARNVADTYNTLTQDKVLSWDQSNASILSVFSLQDFIRRFITISIMVVASFGIYNILNILVTQKRKDIGILRSMGFDSSEVVRLFLIQGLVLGFTGGVLGLGFGYLMSLIISFFPAGGMMDTMIISQDPTIYLSGFAMAMGASIISSVLPARAAGKLKPIDIIRSGE